MSNRRTSVRIQRGPCFSWHTLDAANTRLQRAIPVVLVVLAVLGLPGAGRSRR